MKLIPAYVRTLAALAILFPDDVLIALASRIAPEALGDAIDQIPGLREAMISKADEAIRLFGTFGHEIREVPKTPAPGKPASVLAPKPAPGPKRPIEEGPTDWDKIAASLKGKADGLSPAQIRDATGLTAVKFSNAVAGPLAEGKVKHTGHGSKRRYILT